ncbi:hypothetical protein GQ53DRAFT_844084 [Thozetella sp. PMI_491]|nr:hypothetical protein GQ53DRAFT_844084 [Thozetella sp. PMI_491]
MLVLRGLSTLLVGFTVAILGAPSRTIPRDAIQLARSEPYDWNESGAEPFLEGSNVRRALPTAVPPRPVLLQDGQRANWSPGDRTLKRLPTRDEEPPPPTPPLQDENGTEPLCPGCGANASGVSTVFVTTTRTSTVTVATGSPVTSLVLATTTETLTFVDTGKSTETSTITVTSFFRLARRTEPYSPETTLTGTHLDLKRQAGATITSTITTVITTTKETQSVVFATRTNTVFSTVTVAPNAITTVFTTTTIFTTSPAGSTSRPGPPTSTPGSSSSTTIIPPGSTTSAGPPPLSSTMSMSSAISSTTMASSSTSASDTMMSMMSSSETSGMSSSSTSSPTMTPTPTNTFVPPSALPTSSLTADQIAGIVLGTIAGLLFILLAIFALRWCIRRRRSRIAEMRQQLSTSNLPPGGMVGAAGRNSPPGSATSGLTGEGEVRIVIRPARSQLWPMPPGHGGQTYSFFVEETTTGETTPGGGGGDPATWSNASESGSVRIIPRKPILSASGPGTRTGSSEGGARTASSGGRSVPRTSGTGAPAGTAMRDAAGNSLVSVGWGTSVGGRSSASGAGFTNLSPPPPGNRNGDNGSNGRNGRWTQYPGSWGIGKAM